MYLFWFRKPAAVRDPTVVDAFTASQLQQAMQEVRTREREGKAHHIGFYSLMAARTENYDMHDFGFQSLPLYAGLVLVCAAYGGFHLTAWNFKFPTEIEQQVWAGSCVIIMVASLWAPLWHGRQWVLLSWTGLKTSVEQLFGHSKYGVMLWSVKYFWDYVKSVGALVGILTSVVLLPAFVCARAALLVEAFASLRRVPEGAYATVAWADYIPHI
jgi:hypothetical protein